MKVILMAAGIGSRISNKIYGPKCTLEVKTSNGTMPLVRYTVTRLIEKGHDVAIVTGYMHECIRDALDGLNVKFYHNPFFKVTNSIASLWFAADYLKDEDVLLMNADVYWTDEILESFEKSMDGFTMLADVTRVKDGDYFFGLDGDYIARYGKELLIHERDTEYVGMAVIRKSKVDIFRERLIQMILDGKYDLWWENVLYEYLDVDPVRVVDVEGNFWAEVDYFEDYMRILDFTKDM